MIDNKHSCFKCQPNIYCNWNQEKERIMTHVRLTLKNQKYRNEKYFPEQKWKMKENSFEVSNMYFGFISILFLILSLFVLYVIFLLPFYTFFTLFLPLGAWCIMVLLVAFVIFITCFVTIVTKEYPAETHVWQNTSLS